MILLWGRPVDPPIAAIARELLSRGARPLVVDSADIERVELDPSPGCPGAGQLTLSGGHRVELGSITGAYLRPHACSEDRASLEAADALLAWAEITTAVIVNRPAASASNHSKPFQAQLIAAAGFSVPDTLLTTDAACALEFRGEHGEVIYKSISGVRSIVGRLDPRQQQRMADIASCPVQFQQFIPGTDYRVHVVGEIVHACRVQSSAIDYRYADANDPAIEIHEVALPGDVAARCIELARRLGINLAGIDLRLDDAGRWWCFEVNTAPGFTWYEQHTGLPIAVAVAAHLDLTRSSR